MKTMKSNSVDVIFTDPPYALGSEVIIREDGKPDYKKAVDFMNKWGQPDGKFWEEWFIEAHRILKHGGRVVMFGMDRQVMLNKYYACLAGFNEQQSLYWYFASSFPKSSDLSKNLDKHFGEEREVVGASSITGTRNISTIDDGNGYTDGRTFSNTDPVINYKAIGSHKLAQKYGGFKYSISPLKQTNETIMVFQKPYKTGSCLHDTLAYENGDMDCLCGALNIDSSRVTLPDDDRLNKGGSYSGNRTGSNNKSWFQSGNSVLEYTAPDGRFPAQTFVNSEASELLDSQSGLKKVQEYTGEGSKSGGIWSESTGEPAGRTYGDIGGCSKILHKCDYDSEDYDLYIYCPKVSKSERDLGMSKFETHNKILTSGSGLGDTLPRCPIHDKSLPSGSNYYTCGCKSVHDSEQQQRRTKVANIHPTVKPLSLCLKILQLFKTPNPQLFFDPFVGSGSIPMACEILEIPCVGTEISPEYCDIANARILHAKENRGQLYSKYVLNREIKPENNISVERTDFF
jgi:site-specific DNA-methyltransferase (adenine-specific)